MKWINHQIVTGFIVCTATDDALFTASSIVGTVVPDRVESPHVVTLPADLFDINQSRSDLLNKPQTYDGGILNLEMD